MARAESIKDEIAQAGSELAFIAAEKRDGFFKPVKFLEKHPVSFPFLLDEDRVVTKSYGLYHLIGMDAKHLASGDDGDRSRTHNWLHLSRRQPARSRPFRRSHDGS